MTLSHATPGPPVKKFPLVPSTPAVTYTGETRSAVPSPKRITQQDVARVAGVNRATVSLAVRDHPSLSIKTRERVKAVANKLGYRLDPMLSALAAYRHSCRPPEYRGTLAWIAQTRGEFRWRKMPLFMAYLEAAKKRAEFHGYRLDIVDLSEHDLSWERVASILSSRGIRGVMLCPQPAADTNLERFPWQNFSAVTFGYSITRPEINSVAAAHFRAAMRTMRELYARGYRRIGFAIGREHDGKTDHNYFAGYLMARELLPQEQSIPPLLFDSLAMDSGGSIAEWYDRYRPDAIVLGLQALMKELETHGIRAPADVGLACPLLNTRNIRLAGVLEDSHQIGAAAVDMLAAMLQNGERGIPTQPKRLLVEGLWSAGETLRPVQ